jgi:hypothetical protein
LILTNQLGKAERTLIDKSVQNIGTASAAKLRQGAREFERTLKTIVDHYGVVASLDQLERMISSAEDRAQIGSNTYLCLPKHLLARSLVRYENALPVFPKLPPHARVGHRCEYDS